MPVWLLESLISLTAGFVGEDTVTVFIDDRGHQGPGGPKSADKSFTVRVQGGPPLDIDVLSTLIRTSQYDQLYDFDFDSDVDDDDLTYFVKEIKKTSFGDANFDGRFDSADLISIFVAAHYEDGIPINSVWATGDWNADGEFDSGDLVRAFIDGGYEAASTLGPDSVRRGFRRDHGSLWAPGLELARHRLAPGVLLVGPKPIPYS